MRLEVQAHVVQRAALAVADGDHEALAEEDHDLADLDELVAVDVARGLEHDEERVAAVDLELGALVGVDGVLDGQRVQLEVLGPPPRPPPGWGRAARSTRSRAGRRRPCAARTRARCGRPAARRPRRGRSRRRPSGSPPRSAAPRAGACTVAAPLPPAPRRTGIRLGSGNHDEPCGRHAASVPRTTLDPCTIGYGSRARAGRALARRRRRRRRARGGGDHRARLSAGRRSPRSSRSASSTSSPCCSSPRSGAAGWARPRRWPARWRSTSSTSRRRAASRSPRARTGSRSSSSSSPRWWPARWPSARACARARRRSAARRPTWPPRWRGCCCAARASTRRCPRSRSASPRRSSCRRPRSSCAPCDGDERRVALRAGRPPLGTLLVPAGLRARTSSSACASAWCRRSRRILGAAIERDALQREVVETSALRRSDVPQDRAAARRLARPALAADGDPDGGRRARARARCRPTRARASWWPTSPARRERLSRLVDNLLDMSRLEARTAEPRVEWCSIEEVVLRRRRRRRAAARDLRAGARPRPAAHPRRRRAARARLRQPAGELGALLRAAIRSRCARARSARAILVRIVDRGPGVPAAEHGAHLRALLPRAGRCRTATAARAWGWPSCAASSRPTAGACGSSRCPGQGATLRRRAAGRGAPA